MKIESIDLRRKESRRSLTYDTGNTLGHIKVLAYVNTVDHIKLSLRLQVYASLQQRICDEESS